ncbi:unnamed protein product [Gongylonema pulchrum]|uniref:LAM_G_DOMAIN domain-containing protein n=1 Tax=Gongylonema pulchrum TaxID=637853 RepID=A0A183E9Z3_9BILA|nr:unnamed protein product [Gongylonema pulchrum]
MVQNRIVNLTFCVPRLTILSVNRGIEIVVPYRQYLPRKFFRNFAFTAVVRPDDRQGGYLFAVVNPLDTVVDLGVALESAGDSQTNISLLYTDSSKETDTMALASFLVPEFTGQWAKFALEVHEDSVVLYFRCTRFATRQVFVCLISSPVLNGKRCKNNSC